MLQLLSTDEY